MNCPKCTTANSESAKFCKSCGFHLMGAAAQVPVPQPSGLKCLKCGVENSTNAKFCKACGAVVSRELTTPSQPPAPVPPAVQPPAPGSTQSPAPPPSPVLQPATAPQPPASPSPAIAAAIPSAPTDTEFVKPVPTGVISSRSSKPLQLAVGAVLLALLGALIWVFMGVKPGNFAPLGSAQSSAKSTQAESVASTAAQPLAAASAPVLPTQTAVAAAVVSVPAVATDSTLKASETVKPISSPEKQEQTLPLPAQAPKTSSAAAKPALRTESATPNVTQQSVSPTRRASPPTAVSPPPVASVAAPAPPTPSAPSAPAPAPQPAAAPQAATPPVAPVAQSVAPSSPKEACGKRVFIALAICMQEQCNSARFNAHPQCVQMRQQQKDSQERANNGSN